MDKIVIDRKFISNEVTVNRDAYIFISKDVSFDKLKINIDNCKVKIIDDSDVQCKEIVSTDANVTVVDILNKMNENELSLINDKSYIEYNIIDLLNEDVEYKLNAEAIKDYSDIDINIASVCYKNKNKNYVINTSNLDRNTRSIINCFGIVKDNSKLNYDVTSFIKKGAKKAQVKQSSSILLFDKESKGESDPVLVIEENDVKASHGSSIGKIDDDTMFYLCSRGLSKSEATNLICLGKVQYLINKIDDTDVKELLVSDFKERMI